MFFPKKTRALTYSNTLLNTIPCEPCEKNKNSVMNDPVETEKLLQNLVQFFFDSSTKFTLQAHDINAMTWDIQAKFLDKTIHNPRLIKFPVNKNFSRIFFKKLIDYLQPSQEIHDDIYTHLCSVMSCGEEKYSYKHYRINNKEDDVVTIKETNKLVDKGTTGLRTWEAAIMLTDWALCNKEILRNKQILELGSGVGLTGISIAKLCNVKSMYLTDCHSDVIHTICDNIIINFPTLHKETSPGSTVFKDEAVTVGVMALDWNSVQDLPGDIVPDILIGADIVYDPSIMQPLCNVFKTFFQRNNQLEVYIQSVIRNEETFEMFVKLLGKTNYRIEILSQNNPVNLNWDSSTQRSLLKIKL